jgi:hypothetical protein
LILVVVHAAEKAAISDARVVARRNEWRVDLIGLLEEIAELREGVAADAGNRRAAGRILGDEIGDDIAAELEAFLRDRRTDD